jgi:hypothetical protein
MPFYSEIEFNMPNYAFSEFFWQAIGDRLASQIVRELMRDYIGSPGSALERESD